MATASVSNYYYRHNKLVGPMAMKALARQITTTPAKYYLTDEDSFGRRADLDQPKEPRMIRSVTQKLAVVAVSVLTI